MGAAIDLSFARRPLVIARFHGLPSDDEFDAYLKALADNLHDTVRRGVKTALVLDTTGEPNAVGAAQRKKQAEWLKQHYDALRIGCAGTAFVISSVVVRGAMTAVLWLQDLPYPYAVFKTSAEAEGWCLEQLAAANTGGARSG